MKKYIVILEAVGPLTKKGEDLNVNYSYYIRALGISRRSLFRKLQRKNWDIVSEPICGSLADTAAQAIKNAKSEEEAVLAATISGFHPDFIFRYIRKNITSYAFLINEIYDTNAGKIIWKALPEKILNS